MKRFFEAANVDQLMAASGDPGATTKLLTNPPYRKRVEL